jgi:hypothetical protein
MGDVGDMYKFMNDQRKIRNRKRLQYSTDRLKEFGIDFESKNRGWHFVIKKSDDVYDFYPSTGKYRIRGKNGAKFGKWKFGVDSLIKDMEV